MKTLPYIGLTAICNLWLNGNLGIEYDPARILDEFLSNLVSIVKECSAVESLIAIK